MYTQGITTNSAPPTPLSKRRRRPGYRPRLPGANDLDDEDDDEDGTLPFLSLYFTIKDIFILVLDYCILTLFFVFFLCAGTQPPKVIAISDFRKKAKLRIQHQQDQQKLNMQMGSL